MILKIQNNKILKLNIINFSIIIFSFLVNLIFSQKISYLLNNNLIKLLDILAIILIVSILSIVIIYLSIRSKQLEKEIVIEEKKALYYKIINCNFSEYLKFGHEEILVNLDEDFKKNINLNIKYKSRKLGIILSVLGLVIFLIYNNIILGLLNLSIAIVSLIVPLIFSKKIKINYENYIDIWEKWEENVVSSVKFFEFLKIYNNNEYFIYKFYTLSNKLEKASVDIDKTAEIEKSIKNGVIIGLKSFWIIICTIAYSMHIITIGQIVIFIYIGLLIFDKLPEIYDLHYKSIDARVSSKRLEKLYELKTEKPKNTSHLYKLDSGTIALPEMHHFWLNNYIFKKHHISQGDKVLICGENGVGKTTYMRQLIGLIGKNIILKSKEFNKIGLTYNYLPQNVFIIEENVEELFTGNLNIEEVYEMSKYLNFNIKILWKSSIKSLSGGEMQKLALIYTLCKKENLIFLDEPTNNLDNKTVIKLGKLLKKSQKTIIVISHDTRIFDIFNKKIYLSKNGDKKNVQ